MKRYLLIFLLFVSSFFGADIFRVNLFENGMQIYSKYGVPSATNSKSGGLYLKVPKKTYTSDISLHSFGCELSSIKTIKDDTSLNSRLQDIDDKIALENHMIDFYKSDKESENIKEIVTSQIKTLRDLKKNKEQILKAIENSNHSKTLLLHVDCPKDTDVVASFPIAIKSSLEYKINADTKENSVNIKAMVRFDSLYTFENIEFSYTSSKYEMLKPYPYYPIYIGKKESVMLLRSADMSANEDTINVKKKYSLDKVSIVKGVNEIELFDRVYEVSFGSDIDGYGLSKPFFRANVDLKDESFIPSNANFYIDGSFVKKAFIDFANLKQIYFGEDSFINVKKTVKEKFEKEIGNESQENSLYNYKVTNNHNKSMDISLIEALPISSHSSIKVVPNLGKDFVVDGSGKAVFKKALKSGESFDVDFGYVIIRDEK